MSVEFDENLPTMELRRRLFSMISDNTTISEKEEVFKNYSCAFDVALKRELSLAESGYIVN